MAVSLKMVARPKEMREARKSLGYTQQDLADLLSAALERDISVDTYKKWEAASRRVELRLAKVIAQVIEQPVHKLFRSADKRIKFGAELR